MQLETENYGHGLDGLEVVSETGMGEERFPGGLSADTQRLTSKVRRPGVRQAKQPQVLAIGLDGEKSYEGIALTRVRKPRDVIEMLRILDFELLLVSAGPEDAAMWNMLVLVRRYWPGLRWMLVSADCSERLEILARSLGATSVSADPQVIAELARNCKGKR